MTVSAGAPRFVHGDALELVAGLAGVLEETVERWCVAGSLRRGRPTVKDAEVLAVARPAWCYPSEQSRLVGFGEAPPVSVAGGALGVALEALVRDESFPWGLDPQLIRFGPHYKRLRHRRWGLCLDLYVVDADEWGVQLALRTGPAEVSQALVTRAHRFGWHVAGGRLHGHPKLGGVACPKDARCPLLVPTPEERDFLSALRLPWAEPAFRSILWIQRNPPPAVRKGTPS